MPYRALSLIAKADRRAVDPVYASHRWWARRPPGIMRGLLLASTLPASADISEFWEKYAAAHAHLAGTRVHDMFAGGGAVLVEAARLGATPSGTDVDPLAVEIVRHELQPPDEESLRNTLSELTRHLQEKLAHLFPSVSSAWTPLHYFYLHMVECPKCGTKGPLHRKLIIARDVKKNGGVVRKIESLSLSAPLVSGFTAYNGPTRRSYVVVVAESCAVAQLRMESTSALLAVRGDV